MCSLPPLPGQHSSLVVLLFWLTIDALDGLSGFAYARYLLSKFQSTQLSMFTAACALQAWAVLEAEDGATEEARRLFRLAADTDPSHTYIWQVSRPTQV